MWWYRGAYEPVAAVLSQKYIRANKVPKEAPVSTSAMASSAPTADAERAETTSADADVSPVCFRMGYRADEPRMPPGPQHVGRNPCVMKGWAFLLRQVYHRCMHCSQASAEWLVDTIPGGGGGGGAEGEWVGLSGFPLFGISTGTPRGGGGCQLFWVGGWVGCRAW